MTKCRLRLLAAQHASEFVRKNYRGPQNPQGFIGLGDELRAKLYEAFNQLGEEVLDSREVSSV